MYVYVYIFIFTTQNYYSIQRHVNMIAAIHVFCYND